MSNEPEDEEIGIPEWVVTFGDMMSLLLTFFIMLFSMSEMKNEDRYQAVLDSLRRRFGHQASMASLVPGEYRPRNSRMTALSSMGRAKRESTMNGGDKVKAPVGDNPRVMSPEDNGDPTMGGMIQFAAGSAELTEITKRKLEDIALGISGKLQKIQINGHTTPGPLPEGSSYKDHDDLAHARCRVVRDYLIKLDIKPERLRLMSAAQYEPLDSQADIMTQRLNDRVEVYSLQSLIKGLNEEVSVNRDE